MGAHNWCYDASTPWPYGSPPPRGRREGILWVAISAQAGAVYKMMSPPGKSECVSNSFLLMSVFGMVGLPLFCIGCAFSLLMSCCCTFVRNCFLRYGVEEGRLSNALCRLPRFGTTLRRGGFHLRCGQWFRNRFMHGGGSLFFVVCGRGRILFRSQGANQVFGVARVRPGQCTHVLQFLESPADFAL